MKSNKIGLYARVSSEVQARNKTIESQISAIIEHAEKYNEKIDPSLHFIDNGLSGASLERPGLDLLRDKAFDGGVTKVYLLSPDRLARKSAHQVLLIEEMKRLGVEFSFVNRHIGDTPEDQMLLQIQGVVAEYEREKILERSRRGKLHAANRGKVSVLGGAPYGYYYNKVTETQDASYIIHNDEACVVREVFKLFCKESYSIGAIAKHLTSKGYLTRTGKSSWERSVVWGMLRNPAYKGQAAFRKTKSVKRTKKTKLAIESKNPLRSEITSSTGRPKGEWMYIPVSPIIDSNLFDYAQKKLEDNKTLSPRNNKKYDYLLSGIIRCKNCGYSIYGKPASNSKYKRLYYRCSGQDGYRWENGRVCSGHPVRVDMLDELIWNSVKDLLANPSAVIDEYTSRRSGTKSSDSVIVKKKIEIRKYQQERSRVIDLFQSGIVEKSEIESKLKNLQSKMEQISNEIAFLEKEKKESQKLMTLVENLDDFSRTLTQNLDTCNFEEKKKIVRFLVEEVEVDSEKEKVNIKHILPIKPQKCQLRSGA